MTAHRLRPKHSDEELAQIYATPHDHRIYGRGHHERVQTMIDLAKLASPYRSAADLSCGNGVVINSIDVRGKRYLGDFAPGYEFTGPLESTIHELPKVDLFILGETLEHLDSPKSVLHQIRNGCDALLLSTPIDNWGDTNAEHYWAWGQVDVEDMLFETDFDVSAFRMLDSRVYQEPYCYGIWLAQ